MLLVSDSIAKWMLREHRVVADELVWPVGQRRKDGRLCLCG